MALSDRLESLRKQLDQKQQDREQAKQERRDRIQRNQPEGAREEIQATGRQAQLLAAELGVPRSRAGRIVDRGTDLLTRAAKAGDEALAQLDSDGDGDTDILQQLEAGMREEDGFGAPPHASGPSKQSGRGRQPSKSGSQPQSTPANDAFDADAMQDPLGGGIEREMGFDYDELEQQVDISNIEDDLP
jgi:hypothetical protein